MIWRALLKREKLHDKGSPAVNTPSIQRGDDGAMSDELEDMPDELILCILGMMVFAFVAVMIAAIEG